MDDRGQRLKKRQRQIRKQQQNNKKQKVMLATTTIEEHTKRLMGLTKDLVVIDRKLEKMTDVRREIVQNIKEIDDIFRENNVSVSDTMEIMMSAPSSFRSSTENASKRLFAQRTKITKAWLREEEDGDSSSISSNKRFEVFEADKKRLLKQLNEHLSIVGKQALPPFTTSNIGSICRWCKEINDNQ